MRKSGVVLTVLTFVWTSLLMELAHRDLESGIGATGPVFDQHSCGAVEHHVPISQLHQCIICAQGSQRVSTPPSTFIGESNFIALQAVIPLFTSRPVLMSYLFSGKRGPPSLAV
jgi:hypothetical protein